MNFDDLHTVAGCILTDTGTEKIMHEEGNSFAYITSDGTTERITIEDAVVKVSNTDMELCEEVMQMAAKLDGSDYKIDGIIYALNGIYIIDIEAETAYFAKLPSCEVEEYFDITISDFE